MKEKELGMDLRTYCRYKYIKLDDMAKMIGISKGYLSNLLYEKRKPSKEIAEKIYEVTEGEVTEEDLFPKVCKTCGKPLDENGSH